MVVKFENLYKLSAFVTDMPFYIMIGLTHYDVSINILLLIVCRFIVFGNVFYRIRRIISMDIIKVFGTNVKRYRQATGLSQEAFADKCGMHRTYISAIECYRRSISLENIQRIADALEIETYKLFLESNNDA